MTMLGGAGTLIGPAIGAAPVLLMKNLYGSYSEHWLAIIGVMIHLLRVMFFPGGLWGTLQTACGGGCGRERAAASSVSTNRSGSLVETDDVDLTVAPGGATRHHRAQWRRQF